MLLMYRLTSLLRHWQCRVTRLAWQVFKAWSGPSQVLPVLTLLRPASSSSQTWEAIVFYCLPFLLSLAELPLNSWVFTSLVVCQALSRGQLHLPSEQAPQRDYPAPVVLTEALSPSAKYTPSSGCLLLLSSPCPGFSVRCSPIQGPSSHAPFP